jgi:hypothetical protein
MSLPELDYEGPTAEDLERAGRQRVPSSAAAGALIGIFFAPVIWCFFAAMLGGKENARAATVGSGLATTLTVISSFVAGRYIERIMPATRGFAMGLIAASTLIASGAMVATLLTF